MSYTKSVSDGKNLILTLTTNCSLLDNEKLDFLSSNGFTLTISIDGPKDIHDKNRRFAANGCGTFDVVMSKLKLIEREYPLYLKTGVQFNTVLDPSNEFNCVNQMFVEYDLFKQTGVRASLIDDTFNTEKNDYSSEFVAQHQYDTFKMYASILGWIDVSNVSKLSELNTGKLESFKDHLGGAGIKDEMSHGGPCLIGARRLFMDIHGRFFPCEKVSETNPAMNIGDIDNGFYMDKVVNLLNICRMTEEQCKNCWAINQCKICPAHVADEKGLSVKTKLKACASSKKIVEKDIRTYIAMNEIKRERMRNE